MNGARRDVRSIARLLLFACAGALGPLGALHACTRHADLRDDVGPVETLDPTPDLDASISPVDVSLGSDAHATCADRPLAQGCVGTVDFPCAFSGWAVDIAKKCQVDTGCEANGSIEITMGTDGCISELGMDQPAGELAACVAAEVSAVRCPCIDEESIVHYLGVGNDGVCPEK